MNSTPAMDLDLTNFNEPALDAAVIQAALTENLPRQQTRALRLHDYYANPEMAEPAPSSAGDLSSSPSTRPVYAQEQGLPARIVGSSAHVRKEVVIENDIGWRIDAGVDLLFGTTPTLQSLCLDPLKAEVIERLLASVLEANGGLSFLAKLGLVGSIYGSADVLLRPGPAPAPTPAKANPARGATEMSVAPVRPAARQVESRAQSVERGNAERGQETGVRSQKSGGGENAQMPKVAVPVRILAACRQIGLEIVHPAAGAAVFDPNDAQRLIAYVQHVAGRGPSGVGSKEGRSLQFSTADCRLPTPAMTEILGHTWWQRFQDGALIAQGPNPLGRIPLVHIQNLSRPFAWDGASDVEPLIPLQDELNTRLCDRAHRVTMTSFKMYLGKRIPDFVERKVGPGQMWATDDEKASIETFGGDADCPNERDHFRDVREALDKVSGINPLAAGVVRDKLGNLTSAVALRVTLLGAVARTSRKRLVYGRGIQEIAELALAWLDGQGLFATAPEERRIELHWPPVLPDDLERELALAQERLKVGVPQQTVLRELGYEPEVFGDPTA